ncbi:type IV secretion system DNA-binding domain-containing protein [Oxalobacter vibrioformis]|uniref:Type IV secretion system DNA-binding domain-containing protein n=1 Tax=Oxalobacter vibrioformis TaxID=933080 RepID=A0A9E9LX29_9BURK|nr:type IV secretion system DNA-binding domain-containing protein [Oxalobacter vibrioformis]WAW10866.1 type IV secretion system DNA-binding domain-containing protein [Oxalobacter vibrioformis]
MKDETKQSLSEVKGAVFETLWLSNWGRNLITFPTVFALLAFTLIAALFGGQAGWGAGVGIYVLFFCFGLFGCLKDAFFSKKSGDVFRRGAQIEDPGKIARATAGKGRYSIGGVTIPASAEAQGFCYVGSPGSGKSTAIFRNMSQDREEVKAIVFDLGGESLSRFYRGGDRIMNPLDSRAAPISIFSDLTDEMVDPARLAQALVSADTNDKFWSDSARTCIADLAGALIESGKKTNRDLLGALTTMTKAEQVALVGGRPAATLLGGEEKMSASLRSIISQAGQVLRTLDGDVDQSGFSIRRWMEDDNDRSWLFFSVRNDQLPLLKGLYSYLLETAISCHLSMSSNLDRRIVYYLDEFSTLPPMPSLLQLAALGRKFGSVMQLGFQSMSQLRSCYGREDAQSLLSCLGTWTILRSNDSETAEQLSRMVGQQEILRTNISSAHGEKGSSENRSQQVTQTQILLPSQIQNFADLHGVLKIRGDFPLCAIQLRRVDFPAVTEPFIAKKKAAAFAAAD